MLVSWTTTQCQLVCYYDPICFESLERLVLHRDHRNLLRCWSWIRGTGPKQQASSGFSEQLHFSTSFDIFWVIVWSKSFQNCCKLCKNLERLVFGTCAPSSSSGLRSDWLFYGPIFQWSQPLHRTGPRTPHRTVALEDNTGDKLGDTDFPLVVSTKPRSLWHVYTW